MHCVDVWEDSEELVSDGDEIWLRCKQRQSRGLVHVDWLSFTVNVQHNTADQAIAWRLAERLHQILKGALSESKGAYFYEHSIKIKSAETLLAVIYFGGQHQKNTVHISIPAAAWLASDGDLNQKIYALMLEFKVSHISRIDIARDCFENESNFQTMQEAYQSGDFKPSRGVMASMWTIQDQRRGSTCHVGRRENGKLIRGYEKSMQLARKPGWFRVELELRSINRRIPLEALINPAAYFSGACKYLAKLADTCTGERITTFRNTVALSLEHISHYAKIAYGKLIKFLTDAGVTAEQIIQDLTQGVEGLPRRLRIAPQQTLLHVTAFASAVNTV